MELKILLAAAIFLGGWLWSYLFIRQLMFNYRVAYPLMRKMNTLQENLIAVGAKRYTGVSVAICIGFAGLLLFLLFRFCKLYQIIAFFVGAIPAIIMLWNRILPDNRDMFDTFCSSYCRFVPDDELRTAMYNKKTGVMKMRLREMGIEGNFIPTFDPRKSTKSSGKDN